MTLYVEQENLYDVIPGSRLVEELQEFVETVSVVTNLDKSTCRLLLKRYNWDQSRLLAEYFDNADQVLRSINTSQTAAMELWMESELIGTEPCDGRAECGICADGDVRVMRGSELCRHAYCEDCWRGYVRSRVDAIGEDDVVRCPADRCGRPLDDRFGMRLLQPDSVALYRFMHLITDNFVRQTAAQRLKWCPTPNCPYAFRVLTDAQCLVTCCGCSLAFCFQCAEPWHEPIDCKELQTWYKLCDLDSSSATYLARYTKQCPQCKAFIEKNGGCNHMTCRKCRWEFCWVCIRPWPCRACRRMAPLGAAALPVPAPAQNNLQRYTRCRERFAVDQNRLRSEEDMIQRMAKILRSRAAHAASTSGTQFVIDAIDLLCYCRRFLMYSYVCAFWLTSDDVLHSFEVKQDQLREQIDQFSFYLQDGRLKDQVAEVRERLADHKQLSISCCRAVSQLVLKYRLDGRFAAAATNVLP